MRLINHPRSHLGREGVIYQLSTIAPNVHPLTLTYVLANCLMKFTVLVFGFVIFLFLVTSEFFVLMEYSWAIGNKVKMSGMGE